MKTTGVLSDRRLQSKRKQTLAACFEPLDPRVLFAGGPGGGGTTGNIHVTVMNDVNVNGINDAGDTPLAGWSVFVDSVTQNGIPDAGEPIATTDATGQATFTGLPTNTFTVYEIPPSGWSPAAGFKTFDHASVKADKTTEVLFLNVNGNGKIQGTVWNDLNGDGVHDASDPGIPGWTVFLDQNNNRVLDAGELSTTTDSTGLYTFNDLAPGGYKVREILQPGWNLSLGVDNGVGVSVNAGRTSVLDFGNFNPASLGSILGSVWNDVNADGARAAGDPGLAGWTVYLDLNNNGSLDASEPSAVTDALGVFSFPSVLAGTYHVNEIQQAGWNSSPSLPASQFINVIGGEVGATNVQFGNWTPTLGSISGKAFNDANGDGFISAGETGIAGWTIFIDQNSDGTHNAGEPSATTDASGDYSFSNVNVGANSVREIPQISWTPTAPATGVQLVTVPNGTNVANINFGNRQRTDSAIHGAAFVDSNHNGTRDAGERGLPGITVYLDTNNNGSPDAGEPQTVTSTDLFFTPAVNEAGNYEFTHLGEGSYNVREIVPAVLSATPAAAHVQSFALAAGEDRTNVNFADVFRPNEIHGLIYNDLNKNHVRDPGEPAVAGVTVYVDLNRNNVYDAGEPKTVTGSDGTYAFTTNLGPGSYIVRHMPFVGDDKTYPTTTAGILWPTGVSNPAIGNVSPTSITTSLAEGQTHNETVSLTLPITGALTNKVDVFLLFDDTGSFTGNSPIVRAAFPQIINSLQAALPGADLGFGVGRFEEYANFAAEFPTGRPFILNQPIIAASTPGFSTSIQSALDRTAPGYGGDQPETDIEALYQTATGRGFDGNNNGTTTDSGAAGQVSTQLTPGASGDVPAFGSFTVDPSGNVLPADGNIGGAGFRPGALPIILLATDTGFAFQPKGETSITGLNGLTLPVSALTQTSRPTTPFNSGAGIQETITALNALGALVIGLGTNAQTTIDPRQQLESIAKLTGAVNHTALAIPNGTATPINPGDPFYFQIASGFGASVASGVVSAIDGAATSVAMNIALKSSDPKVQISSTPGVVNGVGAGQTATFDVTFTGDGRPHRFDLQFVRQGSDVVLGSIPVVIGTPIQGDGYEYEDLEEGQIETQGDFGEADNGSGSQNTAPAFTPGADDSTFDDSGHRSVAGWATGISAGPASEASQLVDFSVTNDNNGLFTEQPTIDPDGTLSYTPAVGASGTAIVTVQLADNGGTLNGGQNTSTAATFNITIQPGAITASSAFDLNANALTIDFNRDVAGVLTGSMLQVIDLASGLPVATQPMDYNATTHRATLRFDPSILPDGNYRLSIPAGAMPRMTTGHQLDFFVLSGDANHDHQVNSLDFDAIASNFNQSGMSFSQGDFNYDGKVNALDFNALATRFGIVPVGGSSATSASPPLAAAVTLPNLFGNESIRPEAADLPVSV